MKRTILLFCSLIWLFPTWLIAQDETPSKITVQNRSGELPFSTTIGTDVEHVDATGGGLHVTIPILNLPGRGMNYQFTLYYDARFWVAATRNAGGSNFEIWNIEQGGLWSTSTPYITNTSDTIVCNSIGPSGSVTESQNYIYHDATGAKHPLGVDYHAANCVEGNYIIYNSREPDASAEGMVATFGPPPSSSINAIYLPAGTQVVAGALTNPASYTDVYGNHEGTAPGDLDTLGRIMLTKVDNAGQTVYKVYDSTGTQQSYTVNYVNLAINTAFNMRSIYLNSGNVQEFSGTRQAISSIVLPNGLSYSFQYDNYGMINEVDFPSGAVVTYMWNNDSIQRVRYITSRTLTVNGQVSTWNFARSAGTSAECAPNNVCNKFTVTDPLQNQSVYFETQPGKTYKALIYTGAATGTPLREYDIEFWSDGDDAINLPTAINTKLETGLVSRTEFTYDSATFDYTECTTDPWQCAQDPTDFIRNVTLQTTRGNVLTIKEYDWGQGTPGALIRTTTNKYLHELVDNPSTAAQYSAMNIVGKIIRQTITDSANNTGTDTQYEYDNLTTTGPYLGSLTKVKRWRNTDSGWLATSYSYDSFGNMTSMTDSLQNQTTWAYDDRWANPSCAPGSSNSHAYVTQVTNALNQRVQLTRYPCTGQIQAHKDENDILAGRAGTTYTFDLMNRPLMTSLPDGGQTSFDYHSDALPPKITRTTNITGATSLVTSTLYDGLQRPTQTSIDSDPLGVTYHLTNYDALGRKKQVFNPTRCNPPGTNCGEATWGYTSFGYDGLGRVTSVTSQDGGVTRSSFVGNATTVTDEAGKQRRSISDGLGRLIEVDEPGGAGSAGAQATASVTISGAFNSTWISPGSPHLAATGSALASVTLTDGSSHDFYFDVNQHLCQMSWNSSGWFDQDLTSMTEAGLPLAGSSIAAVAIGGVIHVFYQGANQHIYDMNWTGSIWQNLDMTVSTGASPVSNTKMAIVATGSSNTPMMFYEGTNQHLFCIYWNAPTTAWQNADLHSLSGATNLIAPNGAISAAMWGTTGNIHALFLDANQNLNRIVWSGTAWITNNLTSMTGAAVAVAGSKLTTISTGTSIDLMTFYEGAGQHIYSIYWNNSAGTYQTLDFTVWSGATNIAAVLTSLANNPVGPHMFYFSSNQHLYDMLWNGSAWVNADLTSLANTTAVPASGSSLSSHGTSGGNSYNIFFEGGNQHIYHTYYSPSTGGWFNEDPLVTASNFVVDSGTVSLSIPNGTSNFTATVCYGYSTNPVCAGKPVNASSTDIANALAAVLNGSGSPVNATVAGTTLNLTWRTAGWVTASVASMSSASDNPSLFPIGSFTSTAGSFSGGVDPGSQALTSPLVTLYRYDSLSNLICVEQHGTDTTGTGCSAPVSSDANSTWRVRRFTYDTLSRMISSSNPESNTATVGTSFVRVNTTYTYDANGNLLQKTSPAPNQTGTTTQTISYCYDALNRLTGKKYLQQTCPLTSPVASYTYDQASFNGLTIANGIGRRTGMTDQAGFEAWSYDPMGRPVTDKRTIGSVSKTTSYVYNLMGSPTSIIYPSGSTITYTYNNAGQAISAVDSTNSINYATLAAYSPAGALRSLKNGTNLISTYFYSNRLQPCRITVTTGTSNPLNCADTGATGSIMDLTYGFNLSVGDNGNVISITNNRDSARSQTFAYDSLNRIGSAQTNTSTGTQCFGESFGYDAWGNLLTISGLSNYSGCTQENLGTGANINNQISTNAYDAAGNMTTTGYTYDADNHLLTAGGVTYIYDGDGKRVKKSSGKLYWYGMSADAFDETDLAGSTSNSTFREYVFFTGKRIAQRDSSNTVFYNFADHLGTSRVMVQAGQTTPCYDADFYPFGGGRMPINNSCPSNYKFTGKERDSESGLDDVGARYYSGSIGKFTTPDTFWKDSHSNDPQSWNKYSYGRNNPLRYSDPTGEKASVATSCDLDSNGHDNCTITIQASIAIYAVPGSDLSSSDLETAAKEIQAQINTAWSGQFELSDINTTVTVNTQVSVTVADSQKAAKDSGAQNVIGLTYGNAGKGASSYVDGRSYFGQIFQGGADTGVWNYSKIMGIGSLDNFFEAAAEFGHLLGLGHQSDKDSIMYHNPDHKDVNRATTKDLIHAFGSIATQTQYFYSEPTKTTVVAPSLFWEK